MGKLMKVLAIEQAEEGLNSLKNVFNERRNKSQNKDTLLAREIVAHELLFDDKKLPLDPLISSNARPLKNLGLIYTDGDIIQIRDTYIKHIVNGADIIQAGEVYKTNRGLIRHRRTSNIQYHYYSEALKRYNYLNWLKGKYEEKHELTHMQIALIHYYEGDRITRANADQIANNYGYNSPNSGESLYQEYTTFQRNVNRTANPSSESKNDRALHNKIKSFKDILELLSEGARQRAEDEIKILESKLRKQ